MKYFRIYHYVSFLALLMAGLFLSILSSHTLRNDVIDAFAFAFKDNVSDRLSTPEFEKTTQFAPSEEKVHDVTGKKGVYVINDEGVTLRGLPSSLSNQSEGKSYFVLRERMDQTALNMIRPFVPSEIDDLWILEMKKRGLTGKTMVTLRYPPDTIVTTEKNIKMNFLLAQKIDIYLGLDREIKATGHFSYSILILFSRHPFLWLVYFVFVLFAGLFLFWEKKKTVSYIINESKNQFDLDWDKPVISKLTDGTYQIGSYWFKPETSDLLWKGKERIRWTSQSVDLLLLFLASEEYKLSYNVMKTSKITTSSDYHHIISRFKACFEKDPRIKIENIYKWGFRMFIEENIGN